MSAKFTTIRKDPKDLLTYLGVSYSLSVSLSLKLELFGCWTHNRWIRSEVVPVAGTSKKVYIELDLRSFLLDTNWKYREISFGDRIFQVIDAIV